MALTKKSIEAAIAAGTGGKPYVMMWDAKVSGLGLRIRRGGNASWLYRYRTKISMGSAPSTLTLGKWPTLAVEAARVLALGQPARIAAGGNPAVELRQEKLRVRSGIGAALDEITRFR